MCHPDSTPAGISVRTWTISRPGMDDALCWSSVRLSLPARSSVGVPAGLTASDDMVRPPVRMGSGRFGEELEQGGRGVLWPVLGEEVAGVHGQPADVRRPRPPDVERVAIEARQRAAAGPH